MSYYPEYQLALVVKGYDGKICQGCNSECDHPSIECLSCHRRVCGDCSLFLEHDYIAVHICLSCDRKQQKLPLGK
jgi:hypothetical protein